MDNEIYEVLLAKAKRLDAELQKSHGDTILIH